MMPEKTILQNDPNDMVMGIVEKIARTIAPQKIILFGSHAHGIAGPDSDVDLLVIWDTPFSKLESLRRISRLISPRPAPIDIVIRTPKEIEQAKCRIDPFTNEVLARGIVVYERYEMSWYSYFQRTVLKFKVK